MLKKRFFDYLIFRMHRFILLRAIGKFICRDLTIRQGYYGGIIYLNAVEHSWAWTGNLQYETHEIELKALMLFLAPGYDLLIDIGCNIGEIALSVLLRNEKIKAVCLDPNRRAVSLLKRSVLANRLSGRVEIIEAAVGMSDEAVLFDESNSVSGHISDSGRQVKTLKLSQFINGYSRDSKCLVKIDIEGFETMVLRQISELEYRNNLCLVVELHNLGLNGIGDPGESLRLLKSTGAIVRDLNGKLLDSVNIQEITQAVVTWEDA